MITNATQLEVSLHQLESFQQMLEAMRSHLLQTNPSLFPHLSESYLRRIEELQGEILEYLRSSPASAPLLVRLVGPIVKPGIIKATIASQLINGLQSALYRIGIPVLSEKDAQHADPTQKSIRTLFELELVATAAGSFVLAMDLAPRQQMKLFEDYDIAERAVEKLIGHVNELSLSAEAYTGDRQVLKSLRNVSDIIKKGLERIEIHYHEEDEKAEAVFTPIVKERIQYLLGEPEAGEKTIRGILIEINIENNTCKIHPENESPVSCAYEERLEDELIAALKKSIEMAGQFSELSRPGTYKITRIERFRVLDSGELQ